MPLNRAVALGEADGPVAGLAAPATVDPALPRRTAALAYLHEKAGDPRTTARLYADAARSTPPPTSPSATTSPAGSAGGRFETAALTHRGQETHTSS